MATLDRAVLEISADVDDDGVEEDGQFHMVGNAVAAEQTEVSYLFGGSFARINAVINRLQREATRRGVFLDLGAGSHIYEIQFRGWEGATDSTGADVPWGDTSETKGSISNGTGQDPLFQMQVFQHYLQRTTIDSVNPAQLHIGEYTDGTYSSGTAGVFGRPLDVAVQGPKDTYAAEDHSYFNGTITCIEVERLETLQDAIETLGFK